MNKKSGEVITAVLVGLVIGAIASVVHYNGYAQQRANETGQAFGYGSYAAEQPLMAVGLPVAGAAMGWGVGAILDGKAAKDDKPDVPTIQVESGRDTVITVGGDNTTGSNDQSQPVTQTTTTTTPAAEPAK